MRGLLVVLIFGIFLSAPQRAVSETRALLIGVSDYDDSAGVADLKGPANDVRLLSTTLRNRGIDDLIVLADGVERYWLVPDRLHAPIRQDAVLLVDRPAARAFFDYVASDRARALIESSGYGPGAVRTAAPRPQASLASAWPAVRLTLLLAATTTAVLLVLGTPLAWWLARGRSRWRALVEAAERAGALFSENVRPRKKKRRTASPPPRSPQTRSTPCRAARAALPSNVVAAVAPPPRSSERTAAIRRAREAEARGEVIDVDAPPEVIVIQDSDPESEAELICRPRKVGKKKKRRRRS